MFLLLFSIIFLCGVQSIQPMDVPLSEQDIAFLIDVNQWVLSSSGPHSELEALLKMNQLAVMGVQSIQPMDVPLSEQDIAFLIDVNQWVLSSSGPHSELEALLKMNQLAVMALEKKQNNQHVTSLPVQDQDTLYREAPAFFNFNQQVSGQPVATQASELIGQELMRRSHEGSDQTRTFCNQFGIFPLQGSMPDVSIISGPTPSNTTSAPTSAPQISNQNTIPVPPHRALEDYIRTKYGKNHSHPLIEDGFIIKNYEEIHQYQCTQCDKTFRDFPDAQRHIGKSHLGWQFNCDTCSYNTTNLKTIKMHMRKKHYTCCERKFSSQEELALHSCYKTHHSIHIKPTIMKRTNAIPGHNQFINL